MAATPVSIVGGGLSGLAAALAVVRAGGHAQVFERRSGAGARFHGDFQGLENWSSERDVLDELASFGIEPEFDYAPFRECMFFDPDGREHACRSTDPLWYLVRRGTEKGTLDQTLQARALAACTAEAVMGTEGRSRRPNPATTGTSAASRRCKTRCAA